MATKWVLRPVAGPAKKKKGAESVWIARTADGETVKMPAKASGAKPGSRMRQKGSGARRRQLEKQLAADRRDRIERAARGEFQPISRDGDRVERLKATEPSETYEPEVAVVTDPPLRRSSSHLAKSEPKRVPYASDVVNQGVTVNGRVHKGDPGGDVLARDVERL